MFRRTSTKGIVPHGTFGGSRTIWRLMVSDGCLVIEERDRTSREGFFSCVNLSVWEVLFRDFQLSDKHWTGIETITDGIIYFFTYPQPDMPYHKGVYAIDLLTGMLLWQQEEITFGWIRNSQLFATVEEHGITRYVILDSRTGGIINASPDPALIETERTSADQSEDYSEYRFPVQTDGKGLTGFMPGVFPDAVSTVPLAEFVQTKDLFLCTVHRSRKGGGYEVEFLAVDNARNKVLLSVPLHHEVKGFIADLFFVWKEYVIIIQEKTSLGIYRLTGSI